MNWLTFWFHKRCAAGFFEGIVLFSVLLACVPFIQCAPIKQYCEMRLNFCRWKERPAEHRASQTAEAAIVVAHPTVAIAIHSVTVTHVRSVRLTLGPHILISPLFGARVHSAALTCAQNCACQLSGPHSHCAVVHQCSWLGVFRDQQFWVRSHVQNPWWRRCIVCQMPYELITGDVQPIIMTWEVNRPDISCASIKVTMAQCTVPVAIRYVGTITCYWHIEHRVLVTGVRVFTVETRRGIIPLCRTWRHHIYVRMIAYEGRSSTALVFWHKWRGINTAVTIQCTQCVTSAVLPVQSTAAHRSVNKTSKFLNVKLSSICLYWHSRTTTPPSTNNKIAARHLNNNVWGLPPTKADYFTE
jgi:hypothetical protein